MALTIEEVRKIALLARLQLSAEEEDRFSRQLATIVTYVDQLRHFGTTEANRVSAGPGSQDLPRQCLPQSVVLENAPETYGSFVVVPRVKAGDG